MSGPFDNTAKTVSHLANLYGRSGADRIAELIEAADALVAALQTLRTCPTPDGAERIAIQLGGMYANANQTVTALVREGGE